jgi:4-hydroxy-2-oxoheptanedioate aldolase
VRICKEFNVPVGHPHVDSNNVQEVLDEGYRFLMPTSGRSFADLQKGRQIAGR